MKSEVIKDLTELGKFGIEVGPVIKAIKAGRHDVLIEEFSGKVSELSDLIMWINEVDM